MHARALGSRAGAGKRDVVRIAAEGRDVVSDPSERGALVRDADLDEPTRTLELDAQCGNRSDLRVEIDALLAADAQTGGLIAPEPPPGVGSTVGAFRLVEALGAGGMGTVYRAERTDGGFAQQVAVKILATPVTHAGAARRFRAERQILASLRHPHIVSLLDGGVTRSGHAYLVMECVDGVPIVTHCAARALTLADRLRLFRTVCTTVHYAHRHAVVHRDLKPANILVTADGVLKVVDFGIATLLDESTAARATTTRLGPAALTPNYASPEQLRGLPATTSSDVYALGVLLYELLTGVRPYETEGKPFDEVLRLVVEADPPRPSSRTKAPDSTIPYESKRALKGDLDAIVLRAMDKQPERRYGSAETLAEDLGRFLAGVPVIAREPSFGYVVRKLAVRHKAAFAAMGVSALAIVAALIVAISQVQVANRERERAEQRFNEVQQIANAMTFEVRNAAAPAGSAPARPMMVVVQASQPRPEPKGRGDAAFQMHLARVYVRLAKIYGALKAMPRALGGSNLLIDESTGPPGKRENVDFAEVLSALGDIERARGEHAAACVAYERAFLLYSAHGVSQQPEPLPAVAKTAAACGSKAAQAFCVHRPAAALPILIASSA